MYQLDCWYYLVHMKFYLSSTLLSFHGMISQQADVRKLSHLGHREQWYAMAAEGWPCYRGST